LGSDGKLTGGGVGGGGDGVVLSSGVFCVVVVVCDVVAASVVPVVCSGAFDSLVVKTAVAGSVAPLGTAASARGRAAPVCATGGVERDAGALEDVRATVAELA
jgi:hypothetical protein